MMGLLSRMVDSNLVKPKDYDIYYSKFLIEAKQELKKQAIAEKKKAIQKAEESKTEKKAITSYYNKDDEDEGNEELELYATLLLPYWDINPAVQPVIKQMLSSNDKQLKYSTMLLMLRNNKPFSDTLLPYFAGLDEYRYNLYSDLKQIKKQDQFPAKFNNHLDLGRSALMDKNSYDKPDTLAFVEKIAAEAKGKKGFIYFFKYKTKKDDMSWKLAMVGLVPEDPMQFEFESNGSTAALDFAPLKWGSSFRGQGELDFTGFLETKIKEEEPLADQLRKEVKKKLYSLRKSARDFYEDSDSDNYDVDARINYRD
jgi:hypothetical protein